MKRVLIRYSLLALVVPTLCLAGDQRNATQSRLTPSIATNPAWDSPVILDSNPNGIAAGPIFDALGNAWVVIDDSVNLVAFQSNGTSGTWHAGHVIGPTLGGSTSTVGLAVDNLGGFYVTFNASAWTGGTSTPLELANYTPATGWQAPVQLYNSSGTINETQCAIDSTGRIVVMFTLNLGAGQGPAISSIASNSNQTSWGPVQTITSKEDAGLVPSFAANKNGSRLALIYLADTFGQHGMLYTFFNSSTGKWDTSLSIPNSGNATFSSYGALSSFPITVDESGNVTFVVAETVTARGGARPSRLYAVEGFRYEGGVWSQQQLTQPSGSFPSVENYSGTSINSSGAVLIVTPLDAGSNTSNITVFRYTPGQGWKTEIAAHPASSIADRTKVAWFEGTEAIVVYSDHSITGAPLVSALYSNGAWGTGPPPPGNPSAPIPGLATALTGEVLLVMPENPQVYATFLRP